MRKAHANLPSNAHGNPFTKFHCFDYLCFYAMLRMGIISLSILLFDDLSNLFLIKSLLLTLNTMIMPMFNL
uniref:Uncharacterized protein n=1 Tax=Arundo donax TaxID=35708 RepID=A0A0A9FF97_ARUDO